MNRKTYEIPHPDAHPELPVERGPDDRGVGWWVPGKKHRLLADYVEATWPARSKFSHRVFIDLFCGPGRVQVAGQSETLDGGAVVAWRQSQRMAAGAFTHVFVGDKAPDRVDACVARLKAAGAPAVGFAGPASVTATQVRALVPRGSLCLAYLDPYNLQYLSFDIIKTLAALPKIDFAVHFSVMDLKRNVLTEIDRRRFDAAVPGWQQRIDAQAMPTHRLADAFFDLWCEEVAALGFKVSRRMPLIATSHGAPIYRLVFLTRHELPDSIWHDIAQEATRDLFGD
ncbi:MAG: three-Cys-motif partner protein TcmP [Aquincola tertiaricarbonis]